MKQLKRMVMVAVLCAVPTLALAQGAKTQKAVDPAEQAYKEIRETLGTVPTFLKVYPRNALPGAWREFRDLELSETAIPARYKELIGLAVAAQIPCNYCTFFHGEAAKMNGASQDELNEALSLSAATRKWSTYLNGTPPDMAQFRAEIDRMYQATATGGAGEEGAVLPGEGGLAPMDPAEDLEGAEGLGGAGEAGAAARQTPPKDAAAARQQMQQTFGFHPQALTAGVPEVALPGAWENLRAMETGEWKIPPKYRSLISVAVAAQVPCTYCVYADSKAAMAAGATEQEVKEAVGMAALTRQWSTILNGSLVDEAQFKRETRQILKHAASQQKKQQPTRGGAR